MRTLRLRSAKLSTSSSMLSVSQDAAPSAKCCAWMVMTGRLRSFVSRWFMAAWKAPSRENSPMRNPCEIAGEFLSEWFSAEDTFALLLRHADPSRTRQRIVRQNDLLKSNYLGWLAHENAHGSNVHFSVNPLLFGAKKRTKNAIAEARAMFLDLDEDGDRKMAAIRASDNVPPPSFIIRTSPGKYQILWRVRGFSIPEQEAMLKTLAATFGRSEERRVGKECRSRWSP